jgi:ubiquinone biosynthesis monooxygenase Coq7
MKTSGCSDCEKEVSNQPPLSIQDFFSRLTHPDLLDGVLRQADRALKFVSTDIPAQRPNPASRLPEQAHCAQLSPSERKLAAGLMRVNHVGEVCAQALYQAQAQATSNPELKKTFEAAAQDEADHLAWTAQRLKDLNAQPSLLNPLWYAGAYGLGWVAGRLGDQHSLGFLAETEKQVEAHLSSHLKRLPQHDLASRSIVETMRAEEAEHGHHAEQLGGISPPAPVRMAMKFMSRIMTTVAHRI